MVGAFRWPGLLSAAVATLAAVLPFLGALQGYFLSDDFGLIWLLWDKPAAHFLSLFAAPWTETIYGYRADEIRPTLAFSYWLDARWGAANPVGYHVTNILLHLGNTLLVLALARSGAALPWLGAAFAAVLFALMPVHAETVVWISGRADSLPSLFMLLTLLAYHLWRTKRGAGWYGLALLACFLALFSKQSAIVLPVALVCWDVARGGWPRLRTRAAWAAYAPFVLLTVGYLLLRLLLFGNAVREDALGMGIVEQFLRRQPTYLVAALTGLEHPVAGWDTLALVLGLMFLGGAGTGACVRRGALLKATWWRLLYLGPFWWLATVGPLAVVGYFTARHLYLTSAGLALCCALVAWVAWDRGSRMARGSVAMGGLLLLLGSFSLLLTTSGEWEAAGDFSGAIARDVQEQINAAPEGSLVVVGAPPTGADPALRTWLWGFSTPFALQPPFTAGDLAQRVGVITRPEVHCCASQWADHVRLAVSTWRAAPATLPVIVLGWDAGTQRLLRLTDQDTPGLRQQVEALQHAATAGDLSGGVDAVLTRLGESQMRFRLN